MQQALGRNLASLHEQPERLDAGDGAGEYRADSIGHVTEQLQLDQLPLSLFGSDLSLAAVLADLGEPLEVSLGLLAIEQVADHSMDDQVRVAANR